QSSKIRYQPPDIKKMEVCYATIRAHQNLLKRFWCAFQSYLTNNERNHSSHPTICIKKGLKESATCVHYTTGSTGHIDLFSAISQNIYSKLLVLTIISSSSLSSRSGLPAAMSSSRWILSSAILENPSDAY